MSTISQKQEINDSTLVALVVKERVIDYYARVTQFFAWFFIYPLFNIFFVISIKGQENLRKIKNPLIIISNHISFYDSFLFRLALGIKTKHLPLRFMAVKKFNWFFLNFLSYIKIIDLLYALFGVFTVTPGRGIKKNLREAILIINSGGNVVIYPEGKIISSGTVGEFKRGAAVLARETGAVILPVSFKISQGNIIRRKLYINVGKPLTLDLRSSDIENSAYLRSVVTELYNKN